MVDLPIFMFPFYQLLPIFGTQSTNFLKLGLATLAGGTTVPAAARLCPARAPDLQPPALTHYPSYTSHVTLQLALPLNGSFVVGCCRPQAT